VANRRDPTAAAEHAMTPRHPFSNVHPSSPQASIQGPPVNRLAVHHEMRERSSLSARTMQSGGRADAGKPKVAKELRMAIAMRFTDPSAR
jgi:hypothetical protein